MTKDRYEDRPGRPFGLAPQEEHPYVVEVLPYGEADYARNGLSFETAEDAHLWGGDLMLRWFGAKDYRVVDTRSGAVVEGQ